MNKGRKLYFMILILTVVLVSAVYFSYAIFTNKVEEHGKLNIVAGTLDYKIESDNLKNNQITLKSKMTQEIIIKVISLNKIDSNYELYYEIKEGTDVEVGYSENTKDNPSGTIKADESKEITVTIQNKSNDNATIEFKVLGGFTHNELVLEQGNKINLTSLYVEEILNGADPVLKGNLIPVTIDKDGTVRKADISKKWYSYEEKEWANAVILKDESKTYTNEQTIPEDEIESYFVWIPKYSYQIWDLGTSYTGVTTLDTKKVHAINIQFGTEDTTNSSNSCATPNKTGDSGSCQVGYYMTHPAFTSFGVNGIWVGKFETGYNGATQTSGAEQDSSDHTKIIIKPNVYSWRNITIGHAFQASYNYQREELDSHMMKNTEWGAVAYLSHSKYGTCTNGNCSEVRVNNNEAYITGYAATVAPTKGYSTTSIEGNQFETTSLGDDGTYTVNYKNSSADVASTTGNKTGIYDMSGGSWEYVVGYTTSNGSNDKSELNTVTYPLKYYDIYSSTKDKNYNNRILGDATGEMGPFGSKVDPDNIAHNRSSWYEDYAYFADLSYPWFERGGGWYDGTIAGVFAFIHGTGRLNLSNSFRIVLAPNND